MKKFTLLLLLCVAMAGYCQDKRDFRKRTEDTYNWAIKFKGKSEPIDGYASEKLRVLSEKVELTADQKTNLKSVFKDQYGPFKEAYDKYTTTETAQSKLDLIKTLIATEENFRKLLTEKQLLHYQRAMGGEVDKNWVLHLFYMTEAELADYKIQLL